MMRLRPLAAMTTASTYELLRDTKTLFFTALYPFCMLALFLGMAAVLPANPDSDVDRIGFFLATGLFIVLCSVAFFGIAVPLVTLRERGTLRLLSTTPVSRLTVLLAQAPARLAPVLAQTTVIVLLSAILGYLPAERVGTLLVTCVTGLVLLTPLGFLLGSALPSAEAANNVLAFALIALLGLAGLFFPFEVFPEGAQDLLHALPTGLLGSAIRHDLVGVPARHPAWVAWLACAACGAVLTLAAARAFRWDQPAR